MKKLINLFILLFWAGNCFANTADFLGLKEVVAFKSGVDNKAHSAEKLEGSESGSVNGAMSGVVYVAIDDENPSKINHNNGYPKYNEGGILLWIKK